MCTHLRDPTYALGCFRRFLTNFALSDATILEDVLRTMAPDSQAVRAELRNLCIYSCGGSASQILSPECESRQPHFGSLVVSPNSSLTNLCHCGSHQQTETLHSLLDPQRRHPSCERPVHPAAAPVSPTREIPCSCWCCRSLANSILGDHRLRRYIRAGVAALQPCGRRAAGAPGGPQGGAAPPEAYHARAYSVACRRLLGCSLL